MIKTAFYFKQLLGDLTNKNPKASKYTRKTKRSIIDQTNMSSGSIRAEESSSSDDSVSKVSADVQTD